MAAPKKPKASVEVVNKVDPKVAAFLKGLEAEGTLGDATKPLRFISTGSQIVDRIIGNGDGNSSPGGFPQGFLIEIFGDPSSGKTTIALQHAVEVQKLGGVVVYLDFEHSLRAQVAYLKKLGINTARDKFILIQPKNYEDGIAKLGEAMVTFKPALAIVDSLAACIPKAVADGEVGATAQVGLHAKITAGFLSQITKIQSDTDTTLLVLNQLRKNIKTSKYDPGPDWLTTGGEAIKYYPQMRLELKIKGKEKVSATSSITGAAEDKFTNVKIKVTPLKNKFDIPFVSAEVYLTFGVGFDNVRSVLDMAVNYGHIKGKGWMEYTSATNPANSFKIQGIGKVYTHLKENPHVVEEIQNLLVFKVDVGEMITAAEQGLLDDESTKEVLEEKEKLGSKAEEALKAMKESLGIGDMVAGEAEELGVALD